jgi:hypothetical protein
MNYMDFNLMACCQRCWRTKRLRGRRSYSVGKPLERRGGEDSE